MSEEESTSDRLARLSEATKGVGPHAGFNARVLAAARASRPVDVGFWGQLPRAARWVVPAAALSAVIAMGIAFTDKSDVDDEMAQTYDDTETEW